MKIFIVKRQHLGDKMYMPGDEREASAGDVQHLINNGVLAEKAERNEADKAERTVLDKAEKTTRNK